MSRPPSRPLDLPPHCLAQARCPVSGSGSSKGVDREGCVSVSRWEDAGCSGSCRGSGEAGEDTRWAGSADSGCGSVREVGLALVPSAPPRALSPEAQAAPAVGAGAYPEPGEEIKRFSCQRVLPFYGFWPCPLVFTQPPSGSLCCGPAPAGSRAFQGGAVCCENPGSGGAACGMPGRLEF